MEQLNGLQKIENSLQEANLEHLLSNLALDNLYK